MVIKVLFVCTGNTCRSSMAEGISAWLAAGWEGQALRIESISAGVGAMPGDQASPNAIQALREMDLDLTDHRSRRVDEALVREADIILTMTKGHKDLLLRAYPEAIPKVFLLSEFVTGEERDVVDPYGQSLEIYKLCAQEIKGYIKLAMAKIYKEKSPC